MNLLSLILRILACLSCVLTIVIYFVGGRKVRDLDDRIAQKTRQVFQQKEEISTLNENQLELKKQFDDVSLKLAHEKRDHQLKQNEVLLVTRELNLLRSKYDSSDKQHQDLLERFTRLKNENLELKKQGLDPLQNPRLLIAQIDERQREIYRLENELNDSQLVIKTLFASDFKTDNSFVRIEKFLPEHNIMVLNVGFLDGIRQNIEFSLLMDGILIAKVKAARVTSERSIVNVVSIDEANMLQEGAQFEYLL